MDCIFFENSDMNHEICAYGTFLSYFYTLERSVLYYAYGMVVNVLWNRMQLTGYNAYDINTG